jgi:hypothetical protein
METEVRRQPSTKVARIGGTRTQVYLEEDLDCMLREQPTSFKATPR